MTKNLLTFVNHASFHVSNEHTVLLIDPWVEGPVFNNGWSLLDTSTSNAGLARDLAERKLRTVIWYSHEHPDHFSIGFIRRLKQEALGQVTILFQQTKDKRVVTFLRRNGFEVIESAPGVTVRVDDEIRVTTFPFSVGDSYCLINSGQHTILNINDCALTNADMVHAIKANLAPLCSKIDVLMTQFGYANWVGNPSEVALRRQAAAEKCDRIALQMDILRPAVTIPFASFVSFSSEENCYLNDHQNTAAMIDAWSRLSPATQSVRFMKPGDVVDLERDNAASLVSMSEAAVEHWKTVGEGVRQILPAEPSVSAADIEAAFAKYRKATAANLPWLPYLLEKSGMIKPLLLYITDLNLIARCSYVSGYSQRDAGGAYDISMSSASVAFLFNTEYGFNTTQINGRFRTGSPGAQVRFGRFFMPQNLGRQGYGVSHPMATAGYLAGNVLGRLRGT